jgi:signal transduction histidine kinase/ligand-binding sensor domain-containing protein/DNA-binding response OmpR family regulator
MRRLLFKIGLFIVLTSCFHGVLAMEPDFSRWFQFKNIRTDAGLLHPRVTAIETDSRGFIWVGTQNGLNLYDGHEFKSFTHDENDTTSLSDNDISYIYKDNADNIWIGTVTGMINRYCRKTNSFIRYDLPEKPGKRKDIKKIAADGNDNLWIGYTGGLVKFNPLTGEATKYLNPDFPGTSGSLETFFIDSFGRFWVSYWDGGVYLFNVADGTYSRFTGDGLEFLNRSSVMSMAEDSRHNLWMGSYMHGLLKISHPELKVSVYSHNPLDSAGINSNRIKVIAVDERDNIWIGTEEGGLDYFNREDNIFYHYFSEFQGNEATEGLSIYAMKMSSDGKLWIGTRENGIFMTRTSPVPIKFIQSQNSNEKVVVTSVCQDNQGNVWAAIKGDIARVNLKTYRIEPLNLNLPESPNVIQCDGKGNIWIGGLKGGIYTYNTETQNVEKLFFKELENRKIFSFYFSETRVLVFSGLLGAIDLATRNFEIIRLPTTTNPYAWLETGNEMLFITRTDISWFEKPKNSNLEFKFDSTLNFHFPNSKSIYATTEFLYNATDAGLYRVNRNTGEVRYFNKLPGPVNYEVNVIYQGSGNEIWFSTAYNLVRFDPDDNHFRVYDDFDGVPDIYFRDNVGCKLKNGKIIFGGDNGLVLFDPADIYISPDKPNIEFTGFSVGNIGNTQDLNIEPYRNSGNFIKLKHNQNFFNIRFALLHYEQPEKVLYRYILEGFDTEWTEQYNSREKTYMNLPFGEYLFKVQAKNPDNQWSEIKQLGIRLNPPFWLTWYAYLTYFLIFILLLYMFRNYNIKRERLKNELELQHLKVENVEKLAQKEHELNELKLRFFTNISHEFKTPLTLIISPIEQYMETMKPLGHEIMAQVHANALRLKQLVSQVLDIRKIDQGNMEVTYAYADFIRFASGIAMRFKGLAAKKKLGFEFIAQNEHIFTRFDADKMEKILTNLLSNAIQNTFSGKITLEIGKYSDKHHSEWAEQIEIVVKDTGVGIPEDSLEKIFDRFYQVNQAKSHTGGAGIGLSLVKELVALHQGTVKAESTPGKGSRFIVCFPVIHPEKSSHSEEKTEQEKMPCDLPEPDNLQDDIRKVILIAEDNQEMRNYLVNELSGEYEILEAENGEEGLEKCLKFNPDLIMSDIMMPGTDGFEFCKQVKTDERTSHIPVLLVTALSGSESQQEGYHAGADDYITKPFNITILKEKIRNFLTTREKLKQQFIRDAWSEPEILKIASGDEKFLKKAYEVIEENLSESEFDINDFAGEMATSRSQLYRKLKALTGLSASEFIKITRIKIAARLIKDKNYNVSEAAYTVGFKDPKYFSKCFQKQFGVIPSRFKDSGQPHKV